jgi:hypothetical protein
VVAPSGLDTVTVPVAVEQSGCFVTEAEGVGIVGGALTVTLQDCEEQSSVTVHVYVPAFNPVLFAVVAISTLEAFFQL